MWFMLHNLALWSGAASSLACELAALANLQGNAFVSKFDLSPRRPWLHMPLACKPASLLGQQKKQKATEWSGQYQL